MHKLINPTQKLNELGCSNLNSIQIKFLYKKLFKDLEHLLFSFIISVAEENNLLLFMEKQSIHQYRLATVFTRKFFFVRYICFWWKKLSKSIQYQFLFNIFQKLFFDYTFSQNFSRLLSFAKIKIIRLFNSTQKFPKNRERVIVLFALGTKILSLPIYSEVS